MATSHQPPLYRLMEAVEILREATGNAELQAQTVLTFLFIATRHPNVVAMREVEDGLRLTQTSTSRNMAYLAKGNARMQEAGRKGYGLITVEEDPMYRKRLLARLTPKGQHLADQLSKTIGTH